MIKSEINLFVPGRLCLFGEHSDWAGQMRKFNSDIVPGQALVACTDEGIYATACINDTLKLRTVTPEGELLSFEQPFESDGLRWVAAKGGYFSYIAGVAAYISTYYDIGGIALDCYKITLPVKKGLSSSAAICVLTARAFNRLYGLNLTVRGEMEAAYHGEQLTPSRCGRLDQACAYGKGIMHMRFDGDNLDVKPTQVGKPLYFVFADLKAQKDTMAILRDLNTAYPYPRSGEHHALHDLLGSRNRETIGAVIDAIADGDAPRIGLLMQEAQAQFDRYAAPLSPEELKAEKLHRVLHDSRLKQWVYGGKGVGSQGDGAVQFIAKSAEDQQCLKTYLTDTLGLDCYNVTVPKTEPARKVVNVLVTGGAGYIGSHTCLALQEAGYGVVVLDTLERGHRKAVRADAFIRGDIADTELVKEILRKYDIKAVMHFSAYAYVEESVIEPARYFDNNVTATLKLLEAMRVCGVSTFVFSSSCATYGQPNAMPITEDMPQNPINPYGFTKLAVERALDAYARAYGLSFAALRYFNAAGADPWERLGEDHRPETHAIPLLLSAAAGELPCFKVNGTDFDTGDGSCVRDYIHVTDLADAHVRALERLDDEQVIKLNLGTGKGFSVLELVDAAKRVTGRSFKVVLCERRQGDPPTLVGSNAAAYEMLGWEPKHSDLDTIFKTAWKWKLAHPQGYGSDGK